MMQNAFYFMLKAVFVLKKSFFFSEFLDNVGKWIDKKAQINFKIYDLTNWTTVVYNLWVSGRFGPKKSYKKN